VRGPHSEIDVSIDMADAAQILSTPAYIPSSTQ
jgi:hypothetical protein